MDDLTRARGTAAGVSTFTSSSGTSWGRFTPGTLLAGRFRIVAPLGHGMGEVYRAEDLKLDAAAPHDPARRAMRGGRAMESLPLTTDLSRPYASSSVLRTLAITAMAAYGFYASRGDEPMCGRPLLD